MKYFKSFTLFICSFIFALSNMADAWSASSAQPENSRQQPIPPSLSSVITSLATFNSFYLTRDNLTMILGQHCNKTNEKKFKNYVTVKYLCNEGSGIKSIKLHSVEQEGFRNYLMYLYVDFDPRYFVDVASIAKNTLGHASATLKDDIRWRNNSDKFLNDLGYPTIYVDTNSEKARSRFAVVLEQGKIE